MQIDAIDPELTLKATPPRTARTLISRDHLGLDCLPMRSCSLIAIEAPAGSGKTSLLNQWRREALRRGAITAWLALDERDTPDRFVRGLHIALLLGCGADAPTHAIDRLGVPTENPIDAATAWLGDVASLAREVVLLIDDMHGMPSRTAQELLAYVVLNAPANLKIALGSRVALPSVILDVAPHGHLTVLSAADLSFLPGETERVLRLQLGPRFDPACCARFQELSGGWPLGLQLLISNVRNQPDMAHAIAFMHPGSDGVAHYFDEYLDAQLSAELSDFLLRISIPDVINASLAEALTGRADAGDVLAHLSASSPIFGQVMTHDWLRMHALALEFLRERAWRTLDPAEIDALHLAASRWLAYNGMPEPAARHALVVGHADTAFDLAETCLPEILEQGDLSRVVDWFDRIPCEEALQRPRIASSAAWALAVFAERRGEAVPLIDAVLANPAADPEARASAVAASLYFANSQDDVERVEELRDKWSSMEGVGHEVLDEMNAVVRGFAALYSGQPALARYECRRVQERGEESAFFVTRACLAMVATYSHYWEGRVELAEEICRPYAEAALGRLGRRSTSSTFWDVMLASVLWERNEVEQVAALLHERLEVLERVQDFRLTMFGFLTSAKLAFHHGQESKALQLLDHLARLGELRQLPRLCWEALSEQIRMHCHAGRALTCAGLLLRLEAIAASDAVSLRCYSTDLLNLNLCIARAYASLAAQDFRAAVSHLEPADALAGRLQRGRENVVVKLLTALCKRRLGEESDALLAEAVSLARSCDLRRVVRDAHPDLVSIVEASARDERGQGSASQATSAEREIDSASAATRPSNALAASLLTPKEQEVLHHLSDGAANRRIATVMEVSEETVKWHLKNLFAKLGGANRKHVVERARQLGVLA